MSSPAIFGRKRTRYRFLKEYLVVSTLLCVVAAIGYAVVMMAASGL